MIQHSTEFLLAIYSLFAHGTVTDHQALSSSSRSIDTRADLSVSHKAREQRVVSRVIVVRISHTLAHVHESIRATMTPAGLLVTLCFSHVLVYGHL